MMPTQGMLDLARQAQEAQFDRRASVTRSTLTPDGMGGATATPETIFADLPCRIGPVKTAREREIAERQQLTAPLIVTTALAYGLKAGDQIACGSRHFEVIQVLTGGSRDLVQRVMCNETA